MNARIRLPIVALCFAGVLAGCASVTQGTRFQPPTGWTATPSILGRLQMWIKSGKEKNSTQMLMLVKGTADKELDFNQISASTQTKDMKVLSHGSAKFCGTQVGEEFRAQGTDKDGAREEIQMTTTVIDKDRYVALYLHPVTVPADTQAESAIHSLCPIAK